MKIVVVGTFEAGSQLAYAINTIKMADGFAKNGHDVTILCHPPNEYRSTSEFADQYSILASIKWRFVCKSIFNHQINNHWEFALLALPLLIRLNPDLIYSRTAILTWLAAKIGYKTFVEGHSDPSNKQFYFNYLIKATHYKNHYWITISNFLKAGYIKRGANSEKIIVLPDAVDLELFKRNVNENSNNKFRFDTSNNIVYAGHLYDYKGIPTVLKTASLLPEFNFYFVGGLEHDIERHTEYCRQNGLNNCMFLGMKKFSEVPRYLWAADILLLPPSMNHPSANYTSPVKLGEYLASGTPIIASDIPALKDWVSNKEVYFFHADSEQSLASAIKELFYNHELKEILSNNGKKLADKLSYNQRAVSIIQRKGWYD